MNRLTKKSSDGFLPKYERETKENYYDLVYKLGQLEDLEEELGIDLITLPKALKDGVWFKTENNEILYARKVYISYTDGYLKLRLFVNPNLCKCLVNVSDYGKTWALTREELENEKKQQIKNGYELIRGRKRTRLVKGEEVLCEWLNDDIDSIFGCFEKQVEHIKNKLDLYGL